MKIESKTPIDLPQTDPQQPIEPSEEPKAPNSAAKKLASSVFDVVEMFAWSVFAVLILFTFAFRLCRVEGASMENTLENGQNLLLYSFNYTPEQDDIIVFHLTDEVDNMEKTLVKRVIATGGQEVVIDFDACKITVDGVEYADSHAVLKDRVTDDILNRYTLFAEHHYDASRRTFTAIVPEGYVFVMGDNRNNSKDSRDTDVGFVDERCILGKAFCRISPFTFF